MDEEAITYLASLYAGVPGGWLEITYLTPNPDQWPKTIVDWYPLPVAGIDWDHLVERADKANNAGYGVYYGLAVRSRCYEPEIRTSKRGRPYWYFARGKAADALAVTCLWADIDLAGPEGLAHLDNAAIPPSVIISSGGGWHGIWMLAEPLYITDDNRATVVQTLKGMALGLGGDLAVADLSRIFRLPGYVNTKPNRNNAQCVIYDGFWAAGDVPLDGRFAFDDLRAEYARLAAAREYPTPSRPLDPGEFNRLNARALAYLEHGAPQGSRNLELFTVACFFREAGYTLAETVQQLGPVALSTGLDNDEIEDTIRKGWSRTSERTNITPRRNRRMAAADAVLGPWWENAPADADRTDTLPQGDNES